MKNYSGNNAHLYARTYAEVYYIDGRLNEMPPFFIKKNNEGEAIEWKPGQENSISLLKDETLVIFGSGVNSCHLDKYDDDALSVEENDLLRRIVITGQVELYGSLMSLQCGDLDKEESFDLYHQNKLKMVHANFTELFNIIHNDEGLGDDIRGNGLCYAAPLSELYRGAENLADYAFKNIFANNPLLNIDKQINIDTELNIGNGVFENAFRKTSVTGPIEIEFKGQQKILREDFFSDMFFQCPGVNEVKIKNFRSYNLMFSGFKSYIEEAIVKW